jgi:outer membrane lipoprotein carrier protein
MARATCWRPRRRRIEKVRAATTIRVLTSVVLLAAAAPDAVVAAATPAPAAAATGTTPLDAYLDGLKTLRATFLQTLADAHGHELDRASGTLIVVRPGKFSWDVRPLAPAAAGGTAPPGKTAPTAAPAAGSQGQLMVCDGVNLWFYDRDLQQVTVKPVDSALSATPAMLLSGAADVRAHFNISAAGHRMNLDWVLVEPKDAAADFSRALLGFAGGELERMILEDRLDQTATVIFSKIERNLAVAPSDVSFTPPAGADVIGTPRK